ncbi:penicillin-binding protein activator [Caldovatus sediminis]|uniref:Penicillin-binding protein activator n=1 Tax=Caldovatus sediminis TaxID=2041189 RepID=A0A8J2Z7P4_9PROT|nr:penicillin-binding protein activator [Caldovatus sediminis]
MSATAAMPRPLRLLRSLVRPLPLRPRPALPAARLPGGAARSLVLALVVALAACAPQAPPRYFGGPFRGPDPYAQVPRTQVALLLPLSGGNAQLGRAMLNAAQLALFEQGDRTVEFVPLDTGGSPSGAAAAARTAVSNGARIIVGPLTASETSAAAGAARAARAPMLALTNDAAQAGGGVWTLGITPQQQVERAMQVAAATGARRIGVLAPDDAFGRRLAQAARKAAADLDLPQPQIVMHAPRGDMAHAVRQLADATAAVGGPDAVLIGSSGERARQAAAAIASGGFATRPRLLGHALWLEDESLARDPAMEGALFAAPDPSARSGFVARYLAAFDEQPSRIVAVAYDAAGIAARAAGGGRGAMPRLGDGELFLGADGPIRLLPGGQVARGLAVFTFDGSGEPRLVESAAPPGPAGI